MNHQSSGGLCRASGVSSGQATGRDRQVATAGGSAGSRAYRDTDVLQLDWFIDSGYLLSCATCVDLCRLLSLVKRNFFEVVDGATHRRLTISDAPTLAVGFGRCTTHFADCLK